MQLHQEEINCIFIPFQHLLEGRLLTEGFSRFKIQDSLFLHYLYH